MSEVGLPLWLQNPPPKLKLDQFKLTLHDFQQSGAIFIAQNKNCLLRDQPGLGKTPQSLAAFNALVRKMPELKCVVVCPASLVYQWGDEIQKFTTFKHSIYRGTKKQRLSALKSFTEDPEIQVLVLNYEILRRDANYLIQLYKKFNYVVIYDEAQKLKNFRSQTAKAAKMLSIRALGNKLLTATPIHNKVDDLYGLFRIIDDTLFGNYQDFLNNFAYYYSVDKGSYSIPVITGTKNVALLKDKIKPFVFGREKKDVYAQLPALTFMNRFVELPEHHKEVYDTIAEDNLLMKEEGVKEIERLAALTHMQRCSDAVEHINADLRPSSPKIDECIEMLESDFSEEKVIIYSKYTSTIDILVQKLKKKNIPYYTIDGRVSAPKRDENKKAWESRKGQSVLVISSAGGAGLNLQAAGTIIFLNHPWSYGELLQVWGRIHRIGTEHSKLLIVNLYTKGTIDEDIKDALESKEKVFNKIFLQGGSESDLISSTGDLGTEVWNRARARAQKKM